MKIPRNTKKERFYVAVSSKKALSSWDTWFEALMSVENLRENSPEEFAKVVDIIETSQYRPVHWEV